MEPTTCRTLAAPVVATLEERRSVFECWLRRAADETQARAVVEAARATHGDAGHHCSAFVLGPDGATVRSNDDGEPGGTAGMPMLEALTGSGLTDVVAVVTRWFGGTLLGTGGLVRAYGGAVREALAGATVLERQLVRLVDITVGADLSGRLEHGLRGRGVEVVDVTWGQRVTLRVGVPVARADLLAGEVARLTAGGATLTEAGSTWVDVTP